MKTLSKTKTFKILLALVVAFYVSACDQNMAAPEELTVDQSISIASFTVSDSTITKGDSTILSWKVTDEYSKVSYCQLGPDYGTVVCERSLTVTPDSNTVYTLTVFSDGEAIREKSLQVTVLNPDGQEITTAPEDEICDDKIDNDFDGKMDCDDSDCEEYEACSGGEEEAILEFTTEPSYSPNPATIGEEVTITWDSTFPNVRVSIPSMNIQSDLGATQAGEGSYTFTPTADNDTETITLEVEINGINGNGITEVSKELTVIANKKEEEPAPEFAATIQYFNITPTSSLIEGESYYVSWCVSNADTVNMDGNPDFCGGEYFTASGSGSKHTLKVIDEYGNENTRSLSTSVTGFNAYEVSLPSGIVNVVNGVNDGEIYFVTNSAVYFNGDKLKTSPEEKVNVSSLKDSEVWTVYKNGEDTSELNILSFAVKSDGTYFIGTDKALFSKKTDGTYVQLTTTDGYVKGTALACTKSKVYFGTTKNEGSSAEVTARLYEMQSNSDSPTGYKPETVSYFSGASVDFYQLLVNPDNKKEMMLVTSKGTYITEDEGATFDELTTTTNPVNGAWNFDSSAFVWSQHTAYEYNEDTKALSPLADLTDQSNTINYVAKQNSRYFLAHNSGVTSFKDYSNYEGYPFDVMSTPTSYFINVGVTGIGKRSIIAISTGGVAYSLEYRALIYRTHNFGLMNNFKIGD